MAAKTSLGLHAGWGRMQPPSQHGPGRRAVANQNGLYAATNAANMSNFGLKDNPPGCPLSYPACEQWLRIAAEGHLTGISVHTLPLNIAFATFSSSSLINT